MYVPEHFKEDDRERLQQYTRDYGFWDADRSTRVWYA